MRIIHAVRSDAFGGVERYISNVAPVLARRGAEVLVIGGASDRMSALSDHGVRVRSAASTAHVFRELLRASDYDIVHVHMTAAELAAAPLKPLKRWRLVATRHFGSERGSHPMTRPVVRLAARAIDQEIAPTRFVASQLRGEPVVLHHGVADRGLSRERTDRVLLAQRLEPEKRTDVAIRAWAAAGLASNGWRLDIAGDGSQRRALEKLSAELGLASSVSFLGRRDDVHELMDQAAIFVATGENDAFGLAVVEAMASGTAVIASASGGHLETVGAVTPETLYPPGDIAALAHLLASLIDRPLRESAAFRQRSYQRQQLTLEHHVDALLDTYNRLLRSR